MLLLFSNKPKIMDFKLTEEQIAVRNAARDFAKNVLLPEVRERDRDAER